VATEAVELAFQIYLCKECVHGDIVPEEVRIAQWCAII
jgi:hypothetical protein